MQRAFMVPLLFAALAVFGAYAEPDSDAYRLRWERAWNSAQEEAAFAPSKLTRRMVRAMVDPRPGETAEAHAERSFAAASRVERSIRLGVTYQEARARLRQTLRLESSDKTGKASRMAAKLAKAERKSASRGKSAATKTAKSPEKGKKGR